jgi:hypothetical protein
MMTPYDKLKSLPDAKSYLKQGFSFKQLDAKVVSISDNKVVQQMNDAKNNSSNPSLGEGNGPPERPFQSSLKLLGSGTFMDWNRL